MGRPSTYTQDIADAICGEIAEGRSLRSICKADGMPDTRTVLRWLNDNAEFRRQYAHAREAQADALVEEILEIADETKGDVTTNADGVEVINHEHIQRSRLRVDARKWYAGKVAPKKYGDKLQLAGDAENPLAVQISGLKESLGKKLDRISRAGSAGEPEG